MQLKAVSADSRWTAHKTPPHTLSSKMVTAQDAPASRDERARGGHGSKSPRYPIRCARLSAVQVTRGCVLSACIIFFVSSFMQLRAELRRAERPEAGH